MTAFYSQARGASTNNGLAKRDLRRALSDARATQRRLSVLCAITANASRSARRQDVSIRMRLSHLGGVAREFGKHGGRREARVPVAHDDEPGAGSSDGDIDAVRATSKSGEVRRCLL